MPSRALVVRRVSRSDAMVNWPVASTGPTAAVLLSCRSLAAASHLLKCQHIECNSCLPTFGALGGADVGSSLDETPEIGQVLTVSQSEDNSLLPAG
jgi:hypothetical protein